MVGRENRERRKHTRIQANMEVRGPGREGERESTRVGRSKEKDTEKERKDRELRAA